MTIKVLSAPYRRPSCATHAILKRISPVGKSTSSRRSGRRHSVILDRSSSFSNIMAWDILVKEIVSKELVTIMKLLFPSQKPSKSIRRLSVRVSWSAAFSSSKWRCRNRLCRISTNSPRLLKGQNSRQPLLVRHTSTRPRHLRNWTISVMRYCISSRSFVPMTIITWLVQLCTKLQRSRFN